MHSHIKNVRTSDTDDERTGHPSSSIIKGNNEDIRALTLDNRRVTIVKVSNQLPNIAVLPARSSTAHTLQFSKVCIPKQTTKQQRRSHLDISNRLLNKCHDKNDVFLNCNATVLGRASNTTNRKTKFRVWNRNTRYSP